MKRLFDDNSKYIQEANNLDLEVTKVIGPIVKKWVGEGFCPRDIFYVITGAVTSDVLGSILQNDYERYKARKAAQP